MKALITLFSFLFLSLVCQADCGGVCAPGPGTPDYAIAACKMVNTYPQSIRANTCVSANGCVWRQADEVQVCAPGPGTPDYAVGACQMVNSFPANIRAQTCVNANGCVMQTKCL